jgi:glycosyltransferase involved in cell wall biosynthesis
VVLEAGYARLPTVATNVGGIPEVVTDMESGILVRPKDSGEITRALNYLLNHKTRRAAMGKALYENVTINFTLEKMVRETIALYKT